MRDEMINRMSILAFVIVALVTIAGCGDDSPVVPEIVDTDYVFVVVNNTGIEFDAFRSSSLAPEVWEPMGTLGARSGTQYTSEVDVVYDLRFTFAGDGPDDWKTWVNYTNYSTETQYWVLDEEDLHR